MKLLSISMSGYSPNIADFDNDGWKDIFVSRGDVASPDMSYRVQVAQPNTIFRNLLGERWSALTQEGGFTAQPARRHRGSAIGDFNHDGQLDLVVTAIGAPAEIWMNNSPNGDHWLELALQGSKSNRDGIGARIRLVAGGQAQFNHVTTASGYASSSAGPVQLGLGKAKKVDEIEVRWLFGCYTDAQECRSGPGAARQGAEVRFPSSFCRRGRVPNLSTTFRGKVKRTNNRMRDRFEEADLMVRNIMLSCCAVVSSHSVRYIDQT